MDAYRTLKHCIQSQYFEKEDEFKMKIGSKLLDSCLFKVAAFDMKNIGIYTRHQKDVVGLILKSLRIPSEEWHVQMCMGQVVMRGDPSELTCIETEIAKMLGHQVQHSRTPISSNITKNLTTLKSKPAISNSRLQLSLSDTTFSTKVEDSFTINSKDFSLPKNPYSLSNKTKQEETLMNLLNKQMSQTQSSNYLFCLDGDEFFEAETYLSQIQQINSEMNLLCQKMKFNENEGPFQKDGEMTTVTRTVVVEHKTLPEPVPIRHEGRGRNKKEAKQNANRKILTQIYNRFPRLMAEMKRFQNKS